MSNSMRDIWRTLRVRERWDLYLLGVIAVVAFIVDLVTSADAIPLLAAALVPLTVILLRLREDVAKLVATRRAEAFDLDWSVDPDVLTAAKELWIHSPGPLSSLLQMDTSTLRTFLDAVGRDSRVCVLLSEAAVSAAKGASYEKLAAVTDLQVARTTLATELSALGGVAGQAPGLAIRVTDYWQAYGLIAVNPHEQDGLLILQIPEFKPSAGRPIRLVLSRRQGPTSYDRVLKAGVRLWEEGGVDLDSESLLAAAGELISAGPSVTKRIRVAEEGET